MADEAASERAPSENELERAVAQALVAVWPHVPKPADELTRVLMFERERILGHFEQLLVPIGDSIERKVISAKALRATIASVRAGAFAKER